MFIAVASPSNAYAPLVYIFAALLAGGLIQTLYQAVRNWRRGPIDDQKTISETISDDISGLKDLLAEYRLEAEVTKRQLEDYRKQLHELTRELANAQARIGILEEQLRTGVQKREQIERELEQIKTERDGLEHERDRLETEAFALQERISVLEQKTGITERLAERRPADEPQD